MKFWIDYIKRILFRQFNKETGPALSADFESGLLSATVGRDTGNCAWIVTPGEVVDWSASNRTDDKQNAMWYHHSYIKRPACLRTCLFFCGEVS